MRILLAGTSGFLGTALRSRLESAGHEITQLVRGEASAADQVHWDPYSRHLDPDVVADAEAVINLAGVPIAHWPLTAAYKEKILSSRVATTSLLADTIAGLTQKPALVNASGINIYGDQGDTLLDEDSPGGGSFLAMVAQKWEAATGSATEAGARVVNLRTAVVLDASGGSLKLIKLPFLFGVGGRLGSGDQWFPTISLTDWVEAVTRVTTDDALAGPVNLVAPVPATNAEFTHALGAVLGRPTVVPVPAFAINALADDLSTELLGSVKAMPRRLLEAGFTFRHPTIGEQVRAAFAKA